MLNNSMWNSILKSLSSLKMFDWLAIYGAIISTLIIILEIARIRRDFRNRLIVNIFLSSKIQCTPDGEEIGIIGLYELSIINDSSEARYIGNLGVEANFLSINGGTSIIFKNSPHDVQKNIKLDRGQIINATIDATRLELPRHFLEKKMKFSLKVRGFAEDTLGKVYYSKSVLANFEIYNPS